MPQRLAGAGAPVRRAAADAVEALDHGDRLVVLGQVHRGPFPARAGADDDDVEGEFGVFRHGRYSSWRAKASKVPMYPFNSSAIPVAQSDCCRSGGNTPQAYVSTSKCLTSEYFRAASRHSRIAPRDASRWPNF